MRPSVCVRVLCSMSAAALVIAAGPAVVQAQGGPPSKAFDRLFNAGSGDASRSFTLFVYQGQTTASKNEDAAAPSASTGGYTGFDPSFVVSGRRGSGTAVAASGGASVRRYGNGEGFDLRDVRGGVGAQFTGRRSGLRLEEVLQYSPYYQVLELTRSSLPGLAEVLTANPDGAAAGASTTLAVTTADYGWQMSRSLLMSGSYRLRYAAFGDSPTAVTRYEDSATHDASLRLARQMGPHLVLYGGYGMRTSMRTAGGPAPLRTEDLTFGLDRQQQISIARRTSFDFSTGSSIAHYATGERRFVLTGSGTLRHDFSRTWNASLTARRGVDYLDGLSEPAVSGTTEGYVSGSLRSNVDLLMGVAYRAGDVGVGERASPFRTYALTAQLRAMVTRVLGVYGEVGKYYQDIPAVIPSPAGIRSLIDRSAVRVGIVVKSTSQPRGKQ
jgi:hypothetical protein